MADLARKFVASAGGVFEVRLWPGPAPGALGDDLSRDVPSLTAFFPKQSTGTSVIICPGGGYNVLCDYEGRDYALWLNERGITAFVLKYRLCSHGYHHHIIAGDLCRAVRLVRTHCVSWHLDPSRIGVMGSSAGGHLASTALTHFDSGDATSVDAIERAGSRPDFGILCYPIITLRSMISTDFRQNLLGPSPSQTLIDEASNELHVTQATPPTFIFHTREDAIVSVEHSELFAQALRARGTSVDLHLYTPGAHGIALGVKGYQPGDPRPLHDWTRRLDDWLSACRLAS